MAQSNAFKPSLGRELLVMLGEVLFPKNSWIEINKAKNIRKANEVTRETRELIDVADQIDPRELSIIIDLFSKMLPLVNQSVDSVEKLDDEHLEFKNAIRDLRNAFNDLLDACEYEAEKHEFSALSAPVLAEAWDSPEDEVWDNF